MPSIVVTERKGAYIISGKDQQLVADAVPGAQQVRMGGRVITLVKRSRESTQLITNLGGDTTRSMKTSYSWPGPWDAPFDHQYTTARFMVQNQRCFVFNGTGTGKTASAIWAFDYLHSYGEARKMAVFAPLSGLHTVWESEVFKVTPHLTAAVVHGTPAQRKEAMRLDVDVYITNHKGAATEYDFFANHEGIDVVCVDDAGVRTGAMNHNSDLWACLHDICIDRRVWWMNATPTPKIATNAFAQALIVNPATLPPKRSTDKSYPMFEEKTTMAFSDYGRVNRAGWKGTVHKTLQPAIRIRKEDCLDLPPMSEPVKHEAALTREQKRLINDLKLKAKADLKGGEIDAVNAASVMSKSIQVALGCVIVKEPDPDDPQKDVNKKVRVDCKPRLEILRNIIEQVEGKVLIFSPFRGVVEMVTEEVNKYSTCETIHGGVSLSRRTKIFKAFEEGDGDEPFCLSCHPACMSHALTLVRADTCLWYGPSYGDAEAYQQANDRTHRAGQSRPVTRYHMGAIPYEWRLYDNIMGRVSGQKSMLDLYKEFAYS